METIIKEKTEVEKEYTYELSSNLGFFKRIFLGIALYFMFVLKDKYKFTVTKK